MVLVGCSSPSAQPTVGRSPTTTTLARAAGAPTAEGRTFDAPVLGGGGWSYWDGSVLRAPDGRYHLFASRLADHCGLDTWLHDSEVVEGVADRPQGPYRLAPTPVDGVFAHNPTVVADPAGGYVLFTIGRTEPASTEVRGCADGVTTRPLPGGIDADSCIIDVQHADDLDGPWTARRPISWASPSKPCPTNPAPVVAADGSVTLVYRAYDPAKPVDHSTEYLYEATASRWDAPYHPVGAGPIVPGPAEDPTAWYSQGAYHLIYSRKFTDPRHLGATAESTDGRHWVIGAPLFGLTLRRTDGRDESVARRERAHLVRTGPRSWLLLTAVQLDATSDRTEIVATRVSAPTR